MLGELFRKDPEKNLEEAVERMRECVGAGAPTKATQKALTRLGEAATRVTRLSRIEAMKELGEIALAAELGASSAALFGMAVLIEAGADARLAQDVILARCREALGRVARQVLRVDAGLDEAAARLGRELTSRERLAEVTRLNQGGEDVAIAGLLEPFSQALLVLLTRCKPARQALRRDRELRSAVRVLGRFERGAAGQVARVARVLDDEELLVVHGAHGWLVRVSGVSSNTQLHTLLAAELLSQGLPGKRPAALAIEEARDRYVPRDQLPVVEAVFGMSSHEALGGGAGVELPYDGVPEEIPAVDGVRVVVLGAPAAGCTWRQGREFPAMTGELSIARRLSPDEVAVWKGRMQAAAAEVASGVRSVVESGASQRVA